MNVAQAVKADRARRGNLSRKAYADLVGLTPTKISNIEGNATRPGRKLKSGEQEALTPYIEDLLRLPDDAPVPEVETTDQWTLRRQQLQRDYDAIIDGLRGQPAPIPWPLRDVTIADARPQDLELIQRWVDEMFDCKLPGPGESSSGPPDGPPEEPAPTYDPNGRPDTADIEDAIAELQRHWLGEQEDEQFVYFEDPLAAYRIVEQHYATPIQEGGPEASVTVEPLPDDFQVRHER